MGPRGEGVCLSGGTGIIAVRKSRPTYPLVVWSPVRKSPSQSGVPPAKIPEIIGPCRLGTRHGQNHRWVDRSGTYLVRVRQ